MTETMIENMNQTFSRIADAMNAQMREWKDAGAIRFEAVPIGARFVWTTFDDKSVKMKTSDRRYRVWRADGKSKTFEATCKVLCTVVSEAQ